MSINVESFSIFNYYMKLDKELFDKVAEQAAASPRLRMHYDLRDSADENCQRMLNVLLPGTQVPIHRHKNSSELVICLQGSCIERLYDEQGKETEAVTLTAGGEVSAMVIPANVYHTLDASSGMSVIVEVKAGKFDPEMTEVLS